MCRPLKFGPSRGKVACMMKLNSLVSGIVFLTGFAAIAFYLAPSRVGAQDRSAPFHLEKDCINYTGAAGAYCTVTYSNLPQIPPGSRIFYDQASGIPAVNATENFLDSNIMVFVKPGDWAVGRCTLDNLSNIGLCTLSDGIGPLAGIQAREQVSFLGGSDGALYAWNGTYSFNSY